MKIYTDDPLIHYKDTTINPERTMDEISAILREYDAIDIHWHYKPEANDIYVQFGIEEVIDDVHVKVAAKVVCPVIWNKANYHKRNPADRVEHVDFKVSMRAMYWYIKSQLENSYAMQSSRVAAFLPDMVTPSGRRYFDEMKEHLNKYTPIEYRPEGQREVNVIRPKPKDVTNS